MDRQHTVVLGDLLHHLLQPPGVYLADRSQRIGPAFRRPDVGGEDFDAGEAGVNQLAVAGNGVGRAVVLIYAVGGVVGVGVAPPRIDEVVDALDQVAVVGDGSEVYDRRRAAPDSPQRMESGAGVGRSGHQFPCARLNVGGCMGVGFDAAGYYDSASGVDNSNALVRQMPRQGYGGDPAVLNADIPLAHSRRGNHGPSLDYHVQHGSPPVSSG